MQEHAMSNMNNQICQNSINIEKVSDNMKKIAETQEETTKKIAETHEIVQNLADGAKETQKSLQSLVQTIMPKVVETQRMTSQVMISTLEQKRIQDWTLHDVHHFLKNHEKASELFPSLHDKADKIKAAGWKGRTLKHYGTTDYWISNKDEHLKEVKDSITRIEIQGELADLIERRAEKERLQTLERRAEKERLQAALADYERFSVEGNTSSCDSGSNRPSPININLQNNLKQFNIPDDVSDLDI